jgi:hypothetical protein
MSNADDLRARASRYRDENPPRRQGGPPKESGTRIGTIKRSDSEELRINWQEFEGKPFVSLRMWTRANDGTWWPDPKRGLSFRLRELGDVGEALASAMDMASEYRKSRSACGPDPGPHERSRKPYDPAHLPDRGQGEQPTEFDEFNA